MWTRREFGRFSSVAAAGGLFGGSAFRGSAEQTPAAAGVLAGAARCSVMLWPLVGVAKEFLARLELVASAGYRYVELVNEYRAWSEAEWVEVLARLRALGLQVDAIAPLKLGFADAAGGAAMLAELESVLPVLHRLGSPQVILVSGPRVAVANASAADDAALRQRAAAVETLRKVAAMFEREGLQAVIEPIDRVENPPVYLDSVTEAFAFTREVGSPRVKVLYDFFHEQRTHGDLIAKLEAGIGEVGLVHVAEVPGRHQPGTGEIAYDKIYAALRRLGYGGRVAMEFYPEGEAGAVLREARVEAERALAG